LGTILVEKALTFKYVKKEMGIPNLTPFKVFRALVQKYGILPKSITLPHETRHTNDSTNFLKELELKVLKMGYELRERAARGLPCGDQINLFVDQVQVPPLPSPPFISLLLLLLPPSLPFSFCLLMFFLSPSPSPSPSFSSPASSLPFHRIDT
jgi:hypothetical protein